MAVLQTAPTRGAVDANMRDLETAIAQAGDVDLAVSCELAVPGYAFRAEQRPSGMEPDDERLRRLAAIGPAVSVGIVERNAAGLPYNSTVLIGEAVTVQRKLHAVSYPPWNEHELFAAGDGLELATVHGAKIATLICNDAWHPVMPWLAAHAGAEVLLVPTASIGEGESHSSARSWDAILTHAARILQCFVVFANRVGVEDGVRFWGGSRIIDPGGVELARAGDGEEVISAELDLGLLRRLRRDAPLLQEGRPELVAKMLESLLRGDHRV